MPSEAVLITGASVGIGRELARLFAADGCALILVSRDQQKLEEAAEESRKLGASRVQVLPADLSDTGAAERVFAEATAGGATVEILVNNAGFGSAGPFWRADVEQQLDMIEVNVAALAHLTRLFLPPMIKRGHGRIMNVASVAGFVAGPLMATYYATKAFVISFSLALNDECRGTGVTVTAVCPGPTMTEFHIRAKMANSKLFESSAMTAAEVARIAYRGTMKGKPLVVTGWKNRLMVLGVSLSPRVLAARVAGKMNRGR